ncbi:unnamed protein product [Echinostoma caproni]|uniref:guanylate cyclase n=1 Tax=Echinostoma caproni TaxID=27848 RepID=A0A183ADZ9_9TREM|nr:unnamed protein product [Echinostoma caproni]
MQSSLYREHLLRAQTFGTRATYKGGMVFVKPLRRQCRVEANKETAVEVNKVKDMNNDHICRLIGICLEPGHQYIVSEYCPRGSLQDFLRKEQFTMEWMFKLSLIQDICRGMIYLHQIFGPHGDLKSSNCLLDSRFAVKVTDFGLKRVRGPKSSKTEIGANAYYESLLWTAPELLPFDDGDYPTGTFKGDVYSFAIICQELIYRKGPFFIDDEQQPEAKDIIEAVRARHKPSFRPTLLPHDECNDDLVQLIRRAWDDDPLVRPDFRAIGKLIVTDAPGNLVDNLLDRMQHYTNDLEAMVLKRTEQYKEEKKRAEDLLYSMLPQSVASQLISKKTVQAESFEMVTIYFSDIVGFTSLSAESTPMQVVELLNQLYTLFDDIIGNFDVYKVETIGDAYMVASGLPKRNGLEHARAVARMSIAFLKAIFEFQIPHRPDKRLELRIGIHSALKIHISQETFKVLQKFNCFIMTERGMVQMKGKGHQKTYWLHGEFSFVVDPVPPGAVLVGGPYDGAVGPIKAGAFQDPDDPDGTAPPMINRPQIPHSEPTSPQDASSPLVSGSDSGHSSAPNTAPDLVDTSAPVTTMTTDTGSGVTSAMEHMLAADSSNNQTTGTHATSTPAEPNKRRVGVCQLNGLSLPTDPTAMQV